MTQRFMKNRPVAVANKALAAMVLVVTGAAGTLGAEPAQAQGAWPDKPLKLKYRVWVQPGEMTVEQCNAIAAAFTNPPATKTVAGK